MNYHPQPTPEETRKMDDIALDGIKKFTEEMLKQRDEELLLRFARDALKGMLAAEAAGFNFGCGDSRYSKSAVAAFKHAEAMLAEWKRRAAK